MLSQLTRCAKNPLSRLSSAANQLLRRVTQPARPNLMTGTLADLPRGPAELLAEDALLRQQLIDMGRRTKTPRLTWRSGCRSERRSLGSQLEARPADYPAGHAAPLAPSGFLAILEAEIARASADAATAPST